MLGTPQRRETGELIERRLEHANGEARILKRALVDEQKAKATTKTKTSHEGKNKKPSTVQVSLDNADTVIEGGPGLGNL